MGELAARWLIDRHAPRDAWIVDGQRILPFQDATPYLRERVAETLGIAYDMPWPTLELQTSRDVRRSPLHDRWTDAGAVFGHRAGWERPLWFARDRRRRSLVHGWGRSAWFRDWEIEHRAARERVALFDLTSFAKFEVRGPGACTALQRLASADVDVPVGRIAYTALLNERGTFESDLTIARLAEDRFYVVTAAAQQAHDGELLRRGLADHDAVLEDVTPAVGVLGVMGPRSRDLLAGLVRTDLSSEVLPFLGMQAIDIGPVRARVMRVSYVGELGYELHLPIDQLAGLWDVLGPAARAAGAVNAGFSALNSLRLEKAFGAWGVDLSPDDTPLEAGMSFVCAWDKPGGFRGRDALLAQRERGVRRRLVAFVLDDPEPLLWGGEVVLRDGQPLTYLTSGSYGHTLGAGVGLGYVARDRDEAIDRAWIEGGRYEVDTGSGRYAATPHVRAPVDPDGLRLRG
jgi:4-methylaminobutanoate oxidase (formaldehyde-forming)